MDAARIEVDVEILTSKSNPLTLIGETSALSSVCFVGLSVQGLTETENPLRNYAELVYRLKGNIFLTKSWHDLEL